MQNCWRKSGQEYEPESLKVMQAALDRYLREEGCDYSILKDVEFRDCRRVLNGKAIVLQESGKGKGQGKQIPWVSKTRSTSGTQEYLEVAILRA